MIVFFIIWIVYAFLILLLTVGWYRIPADEEFSCEAVMISVVIAARNEESHIHACLNALLHQTYPREFFEVIVVNDHSEDSTLEQVKRFMEKSDGFPLRLLENEKGVSGKKASLNAGVEASRAVLILTTDADCRPVKTWLASIAAHYAKTGALMMLGPVKMIPFKSAFSRMQVLEFNSLLATSAGSVGIGQAFMANGANLAFERTLFYELGGYAGNMGFRSGDDVFLLHKAIEKRGRSAVGFVKTRRAVVKTEAIKNVKAFICQRLRWAGKARAYRNTMAVLTSFLVFFMAGAQLSSLVYAFIVPSEYYVPVLLFGMKLVIDFPLLLSYSRFMKQGKILLCILPAILVYPFYIIIVAIVSQLVQVNWKDK